MQQTSLWGLSLARLHTSDTKAVSAFGMTCMILCDCGEKARKVASLARVSRVSVDFFFYQKSCRRAEGHEFHRLLEDLRRC